MPKKKIQDKKNSTPNRSLKQKTIRLALQFSFIITAVFLLFILSIRMGFYGKIPTVEELKSIKNMEASEVYSSDGELLGKFYLQDRSAVKYNDISKNIINALVATEDARYYEHNGVDYRSLLRVLVKTLLLQNRNSGGGSTITQQLAKNIYGREQLEHLSTPISKIKEMIIAIRLEKAYSKEEIITLYLNTVPFGDNTFGIESAAQRFFSTSAKNVTVPEAAVLVGMLKANYSYNPRLFPDKSRLRRNVVINQMLKYEYLTENEATNHKNELLNLKYKLITHDEGIATYFREQIRQRAMKWCAANKKPDGNHYNLYTDGLKIYTTLDAKLQRHAENAMRTHMTSLQKVFDAHIKGNEPWKMASNILESAKKQSVRYKEMKKKGASTEEINKAFATKTTMDIFTWEGEKEVVISPVDSIKHYLSFLNTGFLAIDPSTGQTKVWIGGSNFKYFQYDHVVTTTKRQVGSTFKPFVYAAALEKGIAPCDYISAEKTNYENFDNWTPSNGEENYHLKFSMKGGITKSVNTVAVNLIDKVGIANVIKLASKMGIESELPTVPSLALGVANISASELAVAYSTFVNRGTPIQLYTIETIKNKNDEVLYQNAFKPKQQVMTEETCSMMIDMMKNVVNNGTASRLRWKYKLENDLIGKTGTTQDNTDGWFAAATPNLVMISWVGADNPNFRFRTTNLGQGANTALPITGMFLKNITTDPVLANYTKLKFPALSDALKEKMDCVPELEDATFFQKIFGKKDEIVTKEFGDSIQVEKKSFGQKLKGLFKKKD